MRHFIILTLILGLVSGMFYTQEAKAIDPVTIAILAPVAIKAAQVAAPYVIRGLKSGAMGLLEMGKNVLEILLLPLGIIETTLLWPFGMLGTGVQHIAKGFIAPFKLVWNTILLPIRFCGVDI